MPSTASKFDAVVGPQQVPDALERDGCFLCFQSALMAGGDSDTAAYSDDGQNIDWGEG